ncbi:MAG: hypothetical protein K1X42_12685 [Opitutaceae bacterium]|nr:hypothetical protein [Opitutaceae bacterium]
MPPLNAGRVSTRTAFGYGGQNPNRFRSWYLTAMLAGVAVFAIPASAGILDWLLPKHDIQVITVTDTTPAGLLRRPVSVTNPMYYMAVSAGFRDFGGIMGGIKEPPREAVYKAMAAVLAKQGYLPASDQHPAQLMLLWTWGTMNTDRMYSMSNPDDVEGRQINRRQLLRFMGAYKLGLVSKEPDPLMDDIMMQGVLFRNADQELIEDLSTEDLYVIAIAAYDFQAAMKKEKMLLWTTKISCPSIGLSLPETLPVMLALAAPNIGRETPKPVAVRATDKFTPDVKIGESTVVNYLVTTAVPVTEVDPSSMKAKPAQKNSQGKKARKN